jgi:membrane protein DedA with SNARE-associated domain
MVYLIAWFGGKFLIDKLEKWLDITWADVEAIKAKYFRESSADEFVIFLSRAIPVIPSVLFSAASGAMRIKPWKFYLYTAFGFIVRGILLGWLGWQSGEAIFAVSEGVDRWETVFTIGILAVSLGLLIWAYLKRNDWLASVREEYKRNG